MPRIEDSKCYRGHGESLVPPYTRGSVSLSLSFKLRWMMWRAASARRCLPGNPSLGCHFNQERRVQNALDVANYVCQALADIARHFRGCRSTQQSRVQNALDDAASYVLPGPGRYCWPRDRMPFNLRNEVSKCVGRRGELCRPRPCLHGVADREAERVGERQSLGRVLLPAGFAADDISGVTELLWCLDNFEVPRHPRGTCLE